jgi:hypothetical protein
MNSSDLKYRDVGVERLIISNLLGMPVEYAKKGETRVIFDQQKVP